MNRRQFVHYATVGLGGVALHPSLHAAATPEPLHINGARLNRHLA
jgi:hypothetical protein